LRPSLVDVRLRDTGQSELGIQTLSRPPEAKAARIVLGEPSVRDAKHLRRRSLKRQERFAIALSPTGRFLNKVASERSRHQTPSKTQDSFEFREPTQMNLLIEVRENRVCIDE